MLVYVRERLRQSDKPDNSVRQSDNPDTVAKSTSKSHLTATHTQHKPQYNSRHTKFKCIHWNRQHATMPATTRPHTPPLANSHYHPMGIPRNRWDLPFSSPMVSLADLLELHGTFSDFIAT
eukprot:3040543-Prymnesium_polylepis.1